MIDECWLRLECVSILEEKHGLEVDFAFDEAGKMSREQMQEMVRSESTRHGDAGTEGGA